MLRFIATPDASAGITLDFNTSHVKVYPDQSAIHGLYEVNFNTSHVKVYRDRTALYTCSIFISIHLMLRFIYNPGFAYFIFFHFNTSHVKVYQKNLLLFLLLLFYFNTSHVKVYLNNVVGECYMIIFQYISC